ncbi:MAG: glycosyltransferase [Thiogranum sp.]|nr:glycosyltransferase [Thiogranum sp.]
MVARSICQVLGSAEHGGLERHFIDLCNALSERHQVTAIAHPMHAEALAPEVHFVPLDMTGSRLNPHLLLQLHRALRNAMPDLVHSHANKATAMVAMLKPWLSMSFVATLHNDKSRLSMFRKCDAVIAVSRTLAESLPRSGVEVIPNGIAEPGPVDSARIGALQAALENPPLVLAVGRLVKAKGFDLLLHCWRDMSAQLWIAGEGPQRDALQGLIQDYGVSDRVTLLGERHDIDVLMQAADLLVLPSRREGFPYVLVEALFQRLPVVAARVPGAVDLLPPHWMFEVDDAPALTALLQAALAQPEQIGRDFEPVWQRARAECSLQHMVERTEAIYQKVLHG